MTFSDHNHCDALVRGILIKGLGEVREWLSNEDGPYLKSIFDQIGFAERDGAKPYYVVPQSLTFDLKPPLCGNEEGLAEAKRHLRKDVNAQYSGLDDSSLDGLTSNQLLFLLEKFGGTTPARGNNNISAFDAYRVRAARAVIKENQRNDEKDTGYLIINADISGIQRFIYNVSTRGALRGLRSRSFFVELLCAHTVGRVLDAFKLHQANVIMNGGGSVNILSGKPHNYQEILNGINVGINGWLLKQYDGQLSAILTPTETSEEEIQGDVSRLFGRISHASFVKKNMRYEALLRKGGLEFVSPDGPPPNQCSVCRRDYEGKPEREIDPEDGVRCPECEKFICVGSIIPKAKYICHTREDGKDRLEIEDTYYFPTEDKSKGSCAWVVFDESAYGRDDVLSDLQSAQGVIFAKTYAVTNLDLPGDIRKDIAVEMESYREERRQEEQKDRASRDNDRIRWLEDQEDSLRDDRPAMLERLAEAANGANRIGALRMDADNMGRVLQTGFRNDATLEKVCFFSRSINYFFRLKIDALCRLADSGKSMVQLIYSGGDDVFALGAWNDIAHLSILVGDEFTKYTCNNPDIGLSGGFTLHKSKFPVRTMAASSLAALKTSKRNLEPCWACLPDSKNCPLLRKDGHCLRKDSLTPFFTEQKAALKSRLDKEFIRKYSAYPSRLKLSFKRKLFAGKWEPVDEVKNYVLRPHKVFTTENVPQPSRVFFHNVLKLLDTWYTRGLLYLPMVAWMLQKQRAHLRSMVDLESDLSMYDLYDWTLHITSPEAISALHVPLSWAIMSQERRQSK